VIATDPKRRKFDFGCQGVDYHESCARPRILSLIASTIGPGSGGWQ
jgi:hypothetical protein